MALVEMIAIFWVVITLLLIGIVPIMAMQQHELSDIRHDVEEKHPGDLR